MLFLSLWWSFLRFWGPALPLHQSLWSWLPLFSEAAEIKWMNPVTERIVIQQATSSLRKAFWCVGCVTFNILYQILYKVSVFTVIFYRSPYSTCPSYVPHQVRESMAILNLLSCFVAPAGLVVAVWPPVVFSSESSMTGCNEKNYKE